MRMRAFLALLACAVALAFAPDAPAERRPLCTAGPACALQAWPAVLPTVLAGDDESAGLLAGLSGLPRWALPLVPLAADPADGPASGPLSARLTPEQQALLGCGPFWGTDCERDGIDLANADMGVLLQAWPGFAGSLPRPGSVRFEDGTVMQIPGSRGPTPLPPPSRTCTTPSDPACEVPLIVDPLTGRPFPDEMAALSWNFLALLVAMSTGGEAGPGRFDPANPYAHYDPNDPGTHAAQGQCSLLQPQYCTSIRALFEVGSVRAGGNASFGRRDFVWSSARGPARRVQAGCLPARSGLASLRSSPLRGRTGKGRAGRCPTR